MHSFHVTFHRQVGLLKPDQNANRFYLFFVCSFVILLLARRYANAAISYGGLA